MEIDGSSGNTVGGASVEGANVIAQSGFLGVDLEGSSLNLVEGDFIGTDVTGRGGPGEIRPEELAYFSLFYGISIWQYDRRRVGQ